MKVFDDSTDTQFSCVFAHVGIGCNFDKIHLGYWDFSCSSQCTVRPKSVAEFLLKKYGCFEVESFNKIFLYEEDGSSGLPISLDLIGDSLNV